MPWTTFSILTAEIGAIPEADDALLMLNDNNRERSVTFPANIIITDVINTTVVANEHQYAFQVNGVKATSNAYTAVTQPNSSGRISWADMKLTVPAGNSFAVSQGQKAGAAEGWRILIKYEPVR